MQNQTYQMNPVPNIPRRTDTLAVTFPQASASVQAATSDRMTISSPYFSNSTPGPMSVLTSAFTQARQYSNQFPSSVQPAALMDVSQRTHLDSQPPPGVTPDMSPLIDTATFATSAPTAEKPAPCRGHPSPGWCWVCKWRYTSCDQIPHKTDRYCFHCMSSRPWDGVERRD